MASCTVKECGICNEEFNENERCPRNLPCSHCLCTDCISNMIRNDNRSCPFCRRRFQANVARDLRINTYFLDLLRYTKALETKYEPPPGRSPATFRSKMVEEVIRKCKDINVQNVSTCKGTEDRLKTAIQNNAELKRNILENHMKLKCEITSKLKELETGCVIKVKYLDEESERLKQKLNEVQEKQNQLEEVKKTLDESTTILKVDAAIDKAEESNLSVQSWAHAMRTFMSRVEKVSREIRKNVKRTEEKIHFMKEVLILSGDDPSDHSEEVKSIILQDEAQQQLTPGILAKFGPTTQYLVSLEGIYAIQQKNGIVRSAKISISGENKLCLHHLKDGIPPLNVATIEQDEVMRHVDPSSRLTFLEFSSYKAKLGKVYVRLTPDTKRAQNFTLLCTGEMGPSFANTNIICVKNKGNALEHVECGDYESNHGYGGKSLIPGASKEGGGVLQRPRVSGSVFGWWGAGDTKAAQFCIALKDKPNHTLPVVFGNVESGIHVLSEAVCNHPTIRDVRIVDCGIVLSF